MTRAIVEDECAPSQADRWNGGSRFIVYAFPVHTSKREFMDGHMIRGQRHCGHKEMVVIVRVVKLARCTHNTQCYV